LLYGSDRQIARWEAEAKDESAVVPTGYRAFDDYLKRGGLRRSHLAALMGRSNVGKTALVCNVVSRMVCGGAPVLFSSQEMSVAEVTNRLIACTYELPVQDIEDWAKQDRIQRPFLDAYRRDFSALEIYDDDEPTFDDLRQAIADFREKHGTKPVLVQDFMELMSSSGTYGNEVVKVGRIAREFKKLAREQDIPVLVLVQVGRAKEYDVSARNHGHVPLTMEDARWAGEQAFDVMLAMYRPELDPDADNQTLQYGSPKEVERYEQAQEKRLRFKDQAILQVVKNRFGKRNDTGVAVDIDWSTMRFVERQVAAVAA